MAERGGHRLKAALARVAWFAQERPVRAGRMPTVIRAASARAPRGNAGGTAEVEPFVPSLGAKGSCCPSVP